MKLKRSVSARATSRLRRRHQLLRQRPSADVAAEASSARFRAVHAAPVRAPQADDLHTHARPRRRRRSSSCTARAPAVTSSASARAASPVRRRHVKGEIDKKPLSEPVINRDRAPARATGCWAPTAASSRSAGAKFYGSTGSMHLNRPVVGMAPTRPTRATGSSRPTAASSRFGDAKFYGSTGGMHLDAPIVGHGAPRRPARATGSSRADGGVFAFGDAKFFGSTGDLQLNQPIVGMSRTPPATGTGSSRPTAGSSCFGDARFTARRATSSAGLVVGMAPAPTATATGCSNSVGQVCDARQRAVLRRRLRAGRQHRARHRGDPARCSGRVNHEQPGQASRHARRHEPALEARRADDVRRRLTPSLREVSGRRGGAA